MIEVVVVGEGKTEGTFVTAVLVPVFAARGVYLYPRMIPTSAAAKGGSLKRERVVRALRNTLRERDDVYVTTLFDLCGLPSDFPGSASARQITDPLARAAAIEAALAREVIEAAECRSDRFLPHIQPFEFEALLFSRPDAIAAVEPEWEPYTLSLQKARESAPSPEHINDGPDTHPSARLRILKPHYDKVLYGAIVAAHIGLDHIRSECAHFAEWLQRIESLPSLGDT